MVSGTLMFWKKNIIMAFSSGNGHAETYEYESVFPIFQHHPGPLYSTSEPGLINHWQARFIKAYMDVGSEDREVSVCPVISFMVRVSDNQQAPGLHPARRISVESQPDKHETTVRGFPFTRTAYSLSLDFWGSTFAGRTRHESRPPPPPHTHINNSAVKYIF